MILTDAEILQLIVSPKNKDLINFAFQKKQKAELHIQGTGLDRFFEKIDGVENEAYIKLKKKLTNAKTVSIYEQSLRPVDKIFSAKGGSLDINLNNPEKLEILKNFINSNFYKGHTLNEYIEKIWANYGIWIDPLGITYIEINQNTNLPEVSYISLSDNQFINYHDISFTSFDSIDYIIFNKGLYENNKIKYNLFEVVDDYRIVQVLQQKNDKNKITILSETQIINMFGQVPAVFNSNKLCKQNINLFDSYCAESFIIADNYLNDFADYRIYKKKVGIPKIWEFKTYCSACGGTKHNELNETCQACEGTGYENERNLTDIIRVDLLKNDTINYIPPAGAVTLPTDIQTQMLSELDKMQYEIFDTIWGHGTSVSKEKNNTTAFEIATRNENQISKLKSIDRNKCLVIEKIITLLGSFYFQNQFKNVICRPATSYIINSGSESLMVYFEAKKNKANNVILDKLYKDYLASEFQNDILSFERYTKLLAVNPSPHNEITELTNILNEYQKTIKINFERYINMFEIEIGAIELPENTISKIYDYIYKLAKKDSESSETETENSNNENNNNDDTSDQ